MRNTRKLATLALIVLLAPACILVAKDGDWDDNHGATNAKLEKRIAHLEKQVAECKEKCPMPCCAEAAKAP